jgi:2-polyprenyl-6-methoxyphenol hydroxylase-like FAD-dependent oxidoreductase
MTPGDQVDTPYPDALVLPQCDTERILTKRLEELGWAGRAWNGACLLYAGSKGITAALKQSDGRDEIVRCQFLVGCDGARSTVRQLAGVTFGGESMVEIWVLCDAEIAGSSLAPKEAHVFLSPKGPLPLFLIRGNVWRVISTRPASAGLDLPTLSEMQQHLNERGPGGLTLKNPTWLSFFRISERQVDRYVSGNVLLSGDAAHVHSPAGGQGMNTGVQDAFNLGWKLA